MAAEKKKTKAQIKKEETELRHAFIADAFEIVLKKVFEGTKDNRHKIRVGINYQNYNRYIKFSSYGESLEFKIYGDGNVNAELNEFCHSKHDERLFEYVMDKEKQQEFLIYFESLVERLISEFMGRGPIGWHGYMDFVGWTGTIAYALSDMDKAYPVEKNEENA